MNRITTLSLGVCLCASSCFGQAESPLARVQALELPSDAGVIPLIYSPLAKARAVRYRAALEAAHSWYKAQLGIALPVTLAVLDKGDWERATPVPYPMPHNKTGLVVLPSRMEDFPGFAEMHIGADVLAEGISFHEMGHMAADECGIRAGNSWVNELIANIFAQEYLWTHQPDLNAYISPAADSLLPKYTSLADLDYLYDGVSFSNYGWFQLQLNRVAGSIAQGRDLQQIVGQLKIAFPLSNIGFLPMPEVLRRMETVAPGFANTLGPLAKPATIASIRESSCSGAAAGTGPPSFLVIDNRTSGEVVVGRINNNAVTIAGGKWRRLRVDAGERVRLSNGSCLIAPNEPGLAVIEP